MGRRPHRPIQSRFLLSVPRWQDAPPFPWPQVAIAGRSNVGKSSLINFLLGRRALARTSHTPGRTQTLNLFAVEERFVLVDLPGYGYARAPLPVVQRWTERTRDYVQRCPALAGVVLLLDVRREPSAQDRAFAEWVRSARRPLLPVVTKCDKLSRGRRLGHFRAIAAALGFPPGELIATSARAGEGREEVWTRLHRWLEPSEGGATASGEGAGASEPPRVVALDGPSGAGKSTVARRLAERLGWNYIDTGAMYRSVGLKADRLGVPLDDDEALERLCQETEVALRRDADGGLRVFLDGADVSQAIREHRVSDLASRVSARRPVREAMARYQRRLGEASPSVLEGRDIGTVIFPDALLKVFLTASAEERARRRTAELQARGQPAEYATVLGDIRDRDEQDSSREHAPLRAAADAAILDTTALSADQVVERLARMVEDALGGEEPAVRRKERPA
jgi:cytidylate kinase/ribosome biogenesis GTP-binding protein YsxC/EngB